MGVGRIVAFATAVAILGACADDATSGAGSFAGERWTATEELRIGAVDDPVYGLTAIGDAALGPDGTLYTMHGQEPFVRRWSPDGRHLQDIGRAGEGPGEFDTPASMGFFGDSLWVWDRRLYRATWFDADGNVLGTESPEVDLGDAGAEPNHQPARPRGPLRDGSWWGAMPAFSHQVSAGTLTRAPTVRMTAEGEALDTIWVRSYPDRGLHSTLAIEFEGGGSYTSQPLVDAPLTFVDETAMQMTVVERWAAPAGASEAEWTIRRIDATGDTLWSRSVAYQPRPVPSSVADSLPAAYVERFSLLTERGTMTPGRVREIIEENLYLPAHYPPVLDGTVGRDGTVWVSVREMVHPGESGGEAEAGGEVDADEAADRLWYVFDADGSDLAEIRLPSGVRPAVADRSQIWATVRDELDVPYLVRYSIER